MQCDGATDLTGDLVIKSVMGKSFDASIKVLCEQKLDSYFRKNCFGQYLDLSEDNNARFQIKIVYDLLKCRFMYENKYKMDKAWAFEAIPYLRKQVNYQEQVFCPKILRWLSAKTDKNTRFLNLFNPLKEAVDVRVETNAEEHNIIVDNPSTASKEEDKVEPVSLGERKNTHLKGSTSRFSIPTGLPWHLVDEVYIPINCGDEFHWVLASVVLKEKRIRVYDSMSQRRHFGSSSEIQKMAKILITYLDISGFLDQKVHTD
ncbi:hypothetical protein BC332_23502 [Capsicum chinense]|nr:hypothetical protein BC332_23502 [Capsicum chinense]